MTNTAKALACLFCLHMGATTASEGLLLGSPMMRISVDRVSGNIDKLELRIDSDANQDFVSIVRDGNLLSWPELRPDTLRSQGIHSDADGRKFITSVYEFDNTLLLTRDIRFGDFPFKLVMEFKFKNQADKPIDISSLPLNFGIGFGGLFDPKGGYGSSIYAYRDLFLSRSGDPERLELENEKTLSRDAAIDWVGWVNRYHVLAIRPIMVADAKNTHMNPVLSVVETTGELPTPGNTTFTFVFPETLQPGESRRFAFEVMAAPKNRSLLSGVQPDLGGVVLMNLWNWFRWICFAVSQLIYFLFSLTGNWVITLILVALVVRVLTIPITRASLRNQERAIAQQQKMAPLVKSLHERYKSVELSQQIVDLYEREEYDQLLPFKGMLGLFIQIPIFIALFNVLGEAPELSGASFLWVQDLALSDRLFSLGVDLPFFGGYFNLLPFVMGFVTVISTWYANKSSTEQRFQYGALFGMAAVFFVLFYSFPAALVLYWTFSILFQLAQQIIDDYSAKTEEGTSL